jgi:hypothetical protein
MNAFADSSSSSDEDDNVNPTSAGEGETLLSASQERGNVFVATQSTAIWQPSQSSNALQEENEKLKEELTQMREDYSNAKQTIKALNNSLNESKAKYDRDFDLAHATIERARESE